MILGSASAGALNDFFFSFATLSNVDKSISASVRSLCNFRLLSKSFCVAVPSADKTALLWSMETGKCLLRYAGHVGSGNNGFLGPTFKRNHATI